MFSRLSLRHPVASSRRLGASFRRVSWPAACACPFTRHSAYRLCSCSCSSSSITSPECQHAHSQQPDAAVMLASLLDPAETVALIDATGTYAHMDVVPPCDVYDPRLPHARRGDMTTTTTTDEAEWGPLRRAHARGELWRAVREITAARERATGAANRVTPCATETQEASHEKGGHNDNTNNTDNTNNNTNGNDNDNSTSNNSMNYTRDGPPAWFEQLCRDLYFRRHGDEDVWDALARESDPHGDDAVASAVRQRRWRCVPPTTHTRDDHVADGKTADCMRDHITQNGYADDEMPRKDSSNAVDPYLWLGFDLLDVADYTIEPYTFPHTTPFSAMERYQLGLGDDTVAGGGHVCSDASHSSHTTRSSSSLSTRRRVPCRREFIHFCNAYRFPQREQLPTSVGTEPARLWWDPCAARPVVYVQLGPDFPPAAWLPVRPTAASLRRVLSSFARMAALHRDWHHDSFATRYAEVCRVMELQNMSVQPSHGDVNNHRSSCSSSSGGSDAVVSSANLPLCASVDGDVGKQATGKVCADLASHYAAVLRMMAYEARNTPYMAAPLREFTHTQDFLLGEYDDPERLLAHMDLCPFLFAIPHLRTVVDVHAEHMTPTVVGPGVALSLYRCRYSKALLQVTVLLSAEVKLPPQDPEAFHFLWKDSEVQPRLRIPVFARLLWPACEHLHMSGGPGGANLIRRLNRMLHHVPITHTHTNTDTHTHTSTSTRARESMRTAETWESTVAMACDVPIDAAMALLYAMTWAGQRGELLGLPGLRQRVAALEAATQLAAPPRLYPGTRECPNPEYTPDERLGMHIQYLAMLNDPALMTTVNALRPCASAAVRLGCAKAALIAGERETFRAMVASEPEGRVRHYMTRIVRKRKTRDLTDAEPRLLEEQYEFPAPLWTKRGTRMDRGTLEGAVDVARLARR